MTGAGITLSAALEILRDGTENRRMKEIYQELGRQIHHGISASDAMQYMRIFPDAAVHMCHSGEVSGKFTEIMKQLSEHYQKEHQINRKIRESLIYPKILLLVSVVSVLFVFLVVMPMVEPLMREMELPVLTKLLMWSSHMIIRYWHMVLLFLILLAVFGMILEQNRKYCAFRDMVKLKAPLTGKQWVLIYTCRFAKSLSMLYASGLPVPETLEIAGRTLGNIYLENQFERVAKRVRNGEMLSSAIKAVNGLDKKLSAVILVGEETGKLDVVLANIAKTYEFESDAAISGLIRMIEPAMIMIMGVLMGLILLGIMLPVWNMYNFVG